nr:6K1 [Blackberry virus Y]
SADEGKNMCKIFASAILVMMVFDAHRADLMYKSFSQVRALFNTLYDSGNPFNIIFQ